MESEHITRFISLACAGLGAVVIGGLNLLLLARGRRGRLVRATLTAVVAAAALATPSALGHPDLTPDTAVWLAALLGPFLLLGLPLTATAAIATVRTARRPVTRYTLLTISGLTVSLAAIVRCDRTDEELLASTMAELETVLGQSPTRPVEQVTLLTDRGTPIIPHTAIDPREADTARSEEYFLKATGHAENVIRLGPADECCNCHGWVFTGGRYLLSGQNVELILRENGYEPVREPAPGDLAVYRGEVGILHTALVRYVSPGQPVIVEGKGGKKGVYLHAAEQSPYGTDITYYRSERDGHRLRGVPADRLNPGRPTAPSN